MTEIRYNLSVKTNKNNHEMTTMAALSIASDCWIMYNNDKLLL